MRLLLSIALVVSALDPTTGTAQCTEAQTVAQRLAYVDQTQIRIIGTTIVYQYSGPLRAMPRIGRIPPLAGGIQDDEILMTYFTAPSERVTTSSPLRDDPDPALYDYATEWIPLLRSDDLSVDGSGLPQPFAVSMLHEVAIGISFSRCVIVMKDRVTGEKTIYTIGKNAAGNRVAASADAVGAERRITLWIGLHD